MLNSVRDGGTVYVYSTLTGEPVTAQVELKWMRFPSPLKPAVLIWDLLTWMFLVGWHRKECAPQMHLQAPLP